MLEGRSLKESPAWDALQAHYEKIKDIHLRQLFADDPERGERFTVEGANLCLDYSKNRITDEMVSSLELRSTAAAIDRFHDKLLDFPELPVLKY